MPETKSCESYRINKLGTTNDTLTSRGGLAFFVKYVDAVGVLGLLLAKFEGIKKSAKGVSIGNLFLQALYFFFDGTSRHVSYFDELKKDLGYAAVVQMPEKQVASSHAVKRFFSAFCVFRAGAFRWVLKELFVWRQEVENVLLLLYSQPTETFDDPVCLATAALVGIDRLPQIAGASVMEEKDALPYTPKRSRSERIRAGAFLRDTVRKTFTHVVDQEIGEQVHRLIGQRGARLG